jgi:hypothetical protein
VPFPADCGFAQHDLQTNGVKPSIVGCTQAIHRLGVDGAYPECDAAGEEFDRGNALIDLAQDGQQPQRGE